MGVLETSSVLPDLKSWVPFATFTDTERMAEAALAAKTLVAEARRPAARKPVRHVLTAAAPPCLQARLKEATEATRLAAEARAPPSCVPPSLPSVPVRALNTLAYALLAGPPHVPRGSGLPQARRPVAQVHLQRHVI